MVSALTRRLTHVGQEPGPTVLCRLATTTPRAGLWGEVTARALPYSFGVVLRRHPRPRDEVVPIASSRRYAAGRDHVRLVEVDDDHSLLASLDVIDRESLAFFGLASE